MLSESRIGLYSSSYPARRRDFDIIVDILTAAKEDTRKTRIMYKCNLSFKQLKTYLNLLRKMELLESRSNEKNNTRYYRITSKGSEFLKAYSKLKDLMS